MRINILKQSVACLLLLTTAAFAEPQAVSQVDIARSGFVYNRQTDTFDANVSIRNKGAVTLGAPLRLVLESVAPASVSLYNIYGKTTNLKPFVTVPLSGFVLEPGKTVTVPVRFVNLGRAVTAANFSVEAELLTPTTTARLDVRAVFNADNGGTPVEQGFGVKVNGVLRAFSDGEGKASLVVPISANANVTVSRSPNYFGSVALGALAPSETRAVTVEVSDSGEVGENSFLRVDRLQHLMWPRTAPNLTLRFYENETPVMADLVELVELRDPAGGATKDVTTLFNVLADGSIKASTPDFLAALGVQNGKKLLFAQLLDKSGKTHMGEAVYYVARNLVKGRLVAPPSNPGLPLGGIKLQITVLNTDIAFDSETITDGTFPLPFMPGGSVALKATAMSGSTAYIAQGTAVIPGNVQINLTMRSAADIAANVPPVTTSPL
jgi:hypothetical protein